MNGRAGAAGAGRIVCHIQNCGTAPDTISICEGKFGVARAAAFPSHSADDAFCCLPNLPYNVNSIVHVEGERDVGQNAEVVLRLSKRGWVNFPKNQKIYVHT